MVLLALVPLFLEYEAVLTRLEQLAEAKLTKDERNSVLDAFAGMIEPVSFRFLWKPQWKDVGDEMVLETAVNGGAEFLATFTCVILARLPGHSEWSLPVRVRYYRGLGTRNHERKQRSTLPSNFITEEAKRVAKAEGVARNQLINVAVAEKICALRTERYFLTRGGRADLERASKILERAGKNNPPVPGDEI